MSSDTIEVDLADVDEICNRYDKQIQESQTLITKYGTFKKRLSIGSLIRWVKNVDEDLVDSIFIQIANNFARIDLADRTSNGTPPSFLHYWEDLETGSYLVSLDASVSFGHCFGGVVVQSSTGNIVEFSHFVLEDVAPSAFHAEVYNLFHVVDWVIGKSKLKSFGKIIFQVDRQDLYRIVSSRNLIGKSITKKLDVEFRECFKKLDLHFEGWACRWVPRKFNMLADYMSKHIPCRQREVDVDILIRKQKKYKKRANWFFPSGFSGFQKLETKSKKQVSVENDGHAEVSEGDSQYLVDRRIVANLIVKYFQSNRSKEVMENIVSMLGLSEEEKQILSKELC